VPSDGTFALITISKSLKVQTAIRYLVPGPAVWLCYRYDICCANREVLLEANYPKNTMPYGMRVPD
jgi:hypothetical protein